MYLWACRSSAAPSPCTAVLQFVLLQPRLHRCVSHLADICVRCERKFFLAQKKKHVSIARILVSVSMGERSTQHSGFHSIPYEVTDIFIWECVCQHKQLKLLEVDSYTRKAMKTWRSIAKFRAPLTLMKPRTCRLLPGERSGGAGCDGYMEVVTRRFGSGLDVKWQETLEANCESGVVYPFGNNPRPRFALPCGSDDHALPGGGGKDISM